MCIFANLILPDYKTAPPQTLWLSPLNLSVFLFRFFGLCVRKQQQQHFAREKRKLKWVFGPAGTDIVRAAQKERERGRNYDKGSLKFHNMRNKTENQNWQQESACMLHITRAKN